LKTAITHAEFATKADALQSVQFHLGHVINCIEGAKGKNFNPAWENPCEGQGNGILLDLKAARGSTAPVPMVQRADNQALAGRKAKKLAEAKQAAKQAMNLLQQVAKKVK